MSHGPQEKHIKVVGMWGTRRALRDFFQMDLQFPNHAPQHSPLAPSGSKVCSCSCLFISAIVRYILSIRFKFHITRQYTVVRRRAIPLSSDSAQAMTGIAFAIHRIGLAVLQQVELTRLLHTDEMASSRLLKEEQLGGNFQPKKSPWKAHSSFDSCILCFIFGRPVNEFFSQLTVTEVIGCPCGCHGPNIYFLRTQKRSHTVFPSDGFSGS